MPKATKSSASAPKAKADNADKPKRPPTAWQSYFKDNIDRWMGENPGMKRTEGMKALSVEWRDHPDNPNKGQPPKPKKSKAKAKAAVDASSSSEPSRSSPGIIDASSEPGSEF
ncbi:hypothetical protein VNI00_008667 [Paramarasmius palmivorus]|uniref:HMG box domain-containing protein n=1 Tax=Paramarasmius palmivorus TaxID=297713 RepID=A0AAW0CTB7_9AGAR